MINPVLFVPSTTRTTDIYKYLASKGFSVFFPNTAVGEVKAPGRIVVKPFTTSKISGASSTDTFYYILCYVPSSNFETLEPYVKSAKDAMKELFPMIVPVYDETQPYNDDAVKGFMVSVTYKNHKKI